MGQSGSSGQGEAPSAHHSVTDKSSFSKNHKANTSKIHTVAIPGCDLTRIEIKCSHAKEEKKPASGRAGAGANHPVEHKEEGSRIVTIPEEGAAKKATPGPADPPRKVIVGVVPSGRKTTEKSQLSLLKGAIKFDAEHSSGDKATGDKVKFTATVRAKCSKHPLWTIADQGKQVATISKDILEYEFLPPAPDKNKLESVFHAWWLKDVKPRVYEVTCKTCKGADKIEPITIDVYPNMESKVSVDFGSAESEEKGPSIKAHTLAQVMDGLIKALHMIEEEFGEDPAKFVEWPRGKITLSNKWEEDEKSPQAYWGGALEIGLDPLIGAKVHVTLPVLKALKFIPKFIRKHADVDVYLEVSGGLKLKVALDWRLKPGHVIEVTGDMKETLGGDIGLEVGAKGYIGKPGHNVASVVILGKTGVGADASLKFTDEGEVELEGKLSWKGLDVEGRVSFLNGKFEKDVEVEVVKGGESDPMRVLLMQKDAAASP